MQTLVSNKGKFFLFCANLLVLFTSNAQNCVPFKLDTSGSALYWPNTGSSFLDSKGWGSYGSQPGQGGHINADFYAVDWQNIRVPTCDSAFLSPLSGKVIYVFGDCPNHCVGGNGCAGYANQVLIQSDLDTNFYFRAAHFSIVNAYVGEHVLPGYLLGIIGGTGSTTGPHTHCALYYSKAKDLTTVIYLSGFETHAVQFVFSATCQPPVITSVTDILQTQNIRIFPNPVHNQLFFSNSNTILTKTQWFLYDNNGRKLSEGDFATSGIINMSKLHPQVYFLKLTSAKINVAVKIIKL